MEAELLPFLILFLIIGVLSGLLAGLLGIGGGVIIIPAVFYALNFYDFSIEIIMRVAIASSLGVIMITSLSSMYSHYKLRNIDLDIIKKWFGGIIVGSISGVIFANSVDGNILVIIFVIIASIVAIITKIITKIFPSYRREDVLDTVITMKRPTGYKAQDGA